MIFWRYLGGDLIVMGVGAKVKNRLVMFVSNSSVRKGRWVGPADGRMISNMVAERWGSEITEKVSDNMQTDSIVGEKDCFLFSRIAFFLLHKTKIYN
jgi:hypothetical protein